MRVAAPGQQPEVLDLAHAHEDSEFGISSRTSVSVIQGDGLEFSESREVKNFGMLTKDSDGNWESILPDGYDSSKRTGKRSDFQGKTSELMQGFANSLSFYRERAGAKQESAKRAAATVAEKQEVPVGNSCWRTGELKKLFKLGLTPLTFEGVEFALEQRGNSFFLLFPADESEKAADFLNSRNLVLARILFGLEDKEKIQAFLEKFGPQEAAKLKDEHGRNLLHHLLEKKPELVPGVLNYLGEKLTQDELSSMLLAGDSFHYKTPLSIAVTKPELAAVASNMISRIPSDKINQPDLRNNTPLHWAVISHAKNPNPETLKVICGLVAKGGNPLVVDESVYKQSAVQVAFDAAFPKAAAQTASRTFAARFRTTRVEPEAEQKKPEEKMEMLSVVLLKAIYEKELAYAKENKQGQRLQGTLGIEGFWCGRSDKKGGTIAIGFGATKKVPYLEFTPKVGQKCSYSINVEDGNIFTKVTESSNSNVSFGTSTTEPITAKSKLNGIAEFAKKCGIAECGGVKVEDIISKTKSAQQGR